MKKLIHTLIAALSITGCTVAQAQTDNVGTNLSTGNGTNKNGNGSVVPNTPNTGTDNTPSGGYQNSTGGTNGEIIGRDYENTNTQTPNVVGETPPDKSINSDEIKNANMDNRQDKYISGTPDNAGKATTTKTNTAGAKTSVNAKHTSSSKKSSKK